MATDAPEDVQHAVADHLEVETDDLLLISRTDDTFTFRQQSTGATHTASVDIGPEGPVVTVDHP